MNSPSSIDASENASLTWFLSVLKRRWPLLLVPVLVAVAASVALTVTTEPLYRASAEVLIRTDESSNLFPLAESSTLRRSPSAEDGFLGSTEYEDRAREAAGSQTSATIDVGDVNSRVKPSFITFTAIEGSAEAAANVAQAWADTYIEMRHERDESELSSTLSTLTGTREELDIERTTVLSALDPLDRALRQTDDPDRITQLTTQRLVLAQSLEDSLAPIEAQISVIDDELGDLRLVENFLTDPELSARVNRVARVPSAPFAPSIPKNTVIGTILGLLVGAGLVVLRESTDDRVRSADKLSDLTGLTTLTTIPNIRRDKGQPVLTDHGQAEEGFQRLASAIEFSGAHGGQRQVLMFTSAHPTESKTTTIARLGVALAGQGRRTLLIGADLRRPTLAKRFDPTPGPGLAEVLTSLYSFDDAVFHAPGVPRLDVLQAGSVPHGFSPAELVRSPQMAALVADLREQYDHILIDCPPVLPNRPQRVCSPIEKPIRSEEPLLDCRSHHHAGHRFRPHRNQAPRERLRTRLRLQLLQLVSGPSDSRSPNDEDLRRLRTNHRRSRCTHHP